MARPTANDPPAAPGSTPPAKRRRGPNKPRPGRIEVTHDAVMHQAAIVELLTAHAIDELGAAGAAGMELQVNTGQGWRAPGDPGVPGQNSIQIRFATPTRRP